MTSIRNWSVTQISSNKRQISVGISMISTQWSHIVQSCVRTNTPRAEAPSPRSLARRETWTQIAQWGNDIVKHRFGIRLWPGTKELTTLKDFFFFFYSADQFSSVFKKWGRSSTVQTCLLIVFLYGLKMSIGISFGLGLKFNLSAEQWGLMNDCKASHTYRNTITRLCLWPPAAEQIGTICKGWNNEQNEHCK